MRIESRIVAGLAVALVSLAPAAGNPIDDLKKQIEKQKQQQQQHQQQQHQQQQQHNANPQTPAAPTGEPLNAKVNEELMGPRTQRISVSEDGNHIAIVTTKGSREDVMIDGVEGPVFDEIPKMFVSANAAVALSPTGGHSAYLGRRGGDFIAVVDGKEAGTVSTATDKTFGLQGNLGWAFWYNHDGSHLAYAVAEGDKAAMVLDGAKGPAYKQIALPQTALAGKRLVYVAMTDDQKWHAVVDGKQSPAYDTIESMTLSPDGAHYTFFAHGSGAAFAVHDGTEGKHYRGRLMDLETAPDGRFAYQAQLETQPGPSHGAQDILVVDGTEAENTTTFTYPTPTGMVPVRHVAFSPDGKRYAYVQRNTPNPGVQVKVNGKAMGLTYNGASQLIFSPDGSRFAYMATAPNGLTFPVVDGKEGDGCNTYWDLVFSDNGQHYAYVARTQQGLKLYLDGKEQKTAYDFSKGALRFSHDGSHFAYGATSSISNYQAVLDGTPKDGNLGTWSMRLRPTPPIDFPMLQFSPDGSHFVYVANKSDGTAKTSVVVDGTWYQGATGVFSYPSFTPDSKHFATMNWTAKGWTVMVNGKVSPVYDDMLELNLGVCRFLDNQSFRFYGIKGGQIYRVTLTLAG